MFREGCDTKATVGDLQSPRPSLHSSSVESRTDLASQGPARTSFWLRSTTLMRALPVTGFRSDALSLIVGASHLAAVRRRVL